jgi:DNA repair protein RadA/Sms
MAKVKTRYYCQNCGAQTSQWMGKCPSCGAWNTLVEEVISTNKLKSGSNQLQGDHRPSPVYEINTENIRRISTGNNEFDRVLGGGMVPGGITLVGGEPGIGKSTLLLQISIRLPEIKVLYVTGEESSQQVKMRADRIGGDNKNCFIFSETSVETILVNMKELKPEVVVIDSIQTLHTESLESSPGSVSQIRESALQIQHYAKQSHIHVFLIGHITKEGQLAGPKVLEHMVDTVLQFEGDRNYGYRILRAIKNRFGSTAELGIYDMNSEGLAEVLNPSDILLSHRDDSLSGIAISASMEGARPLLIETQALVSTAAYGTPQRSTTGFDARRLNMLLAVLEKRNGFKLGIKDVFLNIAGGIHVSDPAIDLAVIASVLPSNIDQPIDSQTCFAAETGLSGEIRSVHHILPRIAEADKLGFRRIFISKYNTKPLKKHSFQIEIVPVGNTRELFQKLF